MSETVKRRVNFVVEMTFEKSEIEPMSKEELLGALLLVMQRTVKNFMLNDIKSWMLGVTTSPSGELVSYNWFMTDSEAYESEDAKPEGNMQ